jgi:transposase
MTDQINPGRKERKMITKETCKIFIEMNTNGKSVDEIASSLRISTISVKRMKKRYFEGAYDNLHSFKTSGQKKSENTGRNMELKEKLAMKLTENPIITLKRLSNELVTENIKASESTVCRTLKAMEYTRKSVTRVPADRNTINNKNIRQTYARELINISDDNLIFLDESGFNLHLSRNYGYSPKNTKCHINVVGNRGTNVSLLCMITNDGIFSFKLFNGSVNTERFVQFIEENVTRSVTRKYVIMDNASIHKSNIVKAKFLEKNYMVKYLPAYSPQLNPIEEFFGALKNNYRSITPVPKNSEELLMRINTCLASRINTDGFYRNMRSYLNLALAREDFI